MKGIEYKGEAITIEDPLNENTGTADVECDFVATQPLVLYHRHGAVLLADYLIANALEKYGLPIASIILRTGTVIPRFTDFNGSRKQLYLFHGIDLTQHPNSVFQPYQPANYTSIQVLEITERRRSS